MMPLDSIVSEPSRAGMSAGLRILGITTRAELQVFASACTGRALYEWELDALEAALQQADRIDQAKREAWDRAALELSLRESIVDDFLLQPTYGPGLGEPGRIASGLRCARRRHRNKIAAKSRRRNRR